MSSVFSDLISSNGELISLSKNPLATVQPAGSEALACDMLKPLEPSPTEAIVAAEISEPMASWLFIRAGFLAASSLQELPRSSWPSLQLGFLGDSWWQWPRSSLFRLMGFSSSLLVDKKPASSTFAQIGSSTGSLRDEKPGPSLVEQTGFLLCFFWDEKSLFELWEVVFLTCCLWKVMLSSFSVFLAMTFLNCSLPNEELRSSSELLDNSFLGRSLWNEELKSFSEFLEMGFLTRSLWNKELSSCEFLSTGFLT